MKGKVILLTVVFCFIFSLGAFSTAKADTLLFPVLTVNYPNVTTFISVINRGGGFFDSTHLRYVYSYKPVSSGYAGGCYVYSVVRPTWVPDLVSFDAAGVYNGGYALYNDPDVYGGSFALGVGGSNRAYLLVTNSDSFGNRVDVGYNWSLGGEFIVMDIMYGAAWGGKAVNDGNREDYSFYSSGISNAMLVGDARRFAFFAPYEWTTKFFVTPIGGSMNAVDINSTVRVTGYGGSSSGSVTGRGFTTYNFNVSQYVNCTAAVNLSDLMDSTAWSGIYYTGGWGWFNNVGGSTALIYKLQYVFNNYSFGGTNNDAYLLSSVDGP